MPVDLLPSDGSAPRKEFVITGRFVFIALVVFFLVVASVNAIMMTMAIKTFPGIDARNGYDTSQAYNKEIAAARKQSERGWVSDLSLQRQGETALVQLGLKDARGEAVTGLVVEVRLKHPSDRRRDHVLLLRESGPGLYEASAPGVQDGGWEMAVEAKAGDERVYQTNSKVMLKG